MSIKVETCGCGSIFAPAYWNFKKQKFTCKLHIGYPDDSERDEGVKKECMI